MPSDSDETPGHAPKRPRRVLVTGSREWTNPAAIRDALAAEWGDGTTILVHGGCPRGADRIADMFWRRWGGQVEVHPADWDTHGRRAGFTRNAAMVDTAPDVCLAFIHNQSAGASHTAALAEQAGISTRRHTNHIPAPDSVPEPDQQPDQQPGREPDVLTVCLPVEGNGVHDGRDGPGAGAAAVARDGSGAGSGGGDGRARLVAADGCAHRHRVVELANEWTTVAAQRRAAARAGDTSRARELAERVRGIEHAIQHQYAACEHDPRGDAHEQNKGVTPAARTEARRDFHPTTNPAPATGSTETGSAAASPSVPADVGASVQRAHAAVTRTAAALHTAEHQHPTHQPTRHRDHGTRHTEATHLPETAQAVPLFDITA